MASGDCGEDACLDDHPSVTTSRSVRVVEIHGDLVKVYAADHLF